VTSVDGCRLALSEELIQSPPKGGGYRVDAQLQRPTAQPIGAKVNDTNGFVDEKGKIRTKRKRFGPRICVSACLPGYNARCITARLQPAAKPSLLAC